ncbi:MAG: DUF839 domain-containing protein [Bdellovibrionales bacterium]|nr:DUF839 domain-containing protein [Bdellovibrionales bacterium]
MDRRTFLSFLGRAAVAAPFLSTIPLGCSSQESAAPLPAPPFPPLGVSHADDLVLTEGLSYSILAGQGLPINAKGDLFGCDNDYIAFLPLSGKKNEALLWVNHESTSEIFVSGFTGGVKTREQVQLEQKSVGGSILHLRAGDTGWKIVPDSAYNRRLDATTRMPFVTERPILGSDHATGTLANCAGGVTPWGTVLTCEENYDMFYGEMAYDEKGRRTWQPGRYRQLGWEKHFPYPPEHYGWVVEVDLRLGRAKKLTALGRFAHESATVAKAGNGRAVVYMGDDTSDQCLYKFIADAPGTLDSGTLHVADFSRGKWIPLVWEKNPALKKAFKDQTDLLIRTREAAAIVGGTKLDRPEDVEVDPTTGAVLVALTGNPKKGNLHGSILRLAEKNPLSLEFTHSTFLTGGDELGFSHPDNLAFDPKGNLWFTTDVHDKLLGRGPWKDMGHNSLFYVPMNGENAGRPFRVAAAPNEAELTGPCFSPDGGTLFLSVQHPGLMTTDPAHPTSRWPGKTGEPKSAVVAIRGPLLDRLVRG